MAASRRPGPGCDLCASRAAVPVHGLREIASVTIRWTCGGAWRAGVNVSVPSGMQDPHT